MREHLTALVVLVLVVPPACRPAAGDICDPGVPMKNEGVDLCVYGQELVIETGFSCPPERPHRIDAECVVICSAEPGLDPQAQEDIRNQYREEHPLENGGDDSPAFGCEREPDLFRLPLLLVGPLSDCDPEPPPDPCDLIHAFDDVMVGRIQDLRPGGDPVVSEEGDELSAGACPAERLVPALDVVLDQVDLLTGPSQTDVVVRIGRGWWHWRGAGWHSGWIPAPLFEGDEVTWDDAPLFAVYDHQPDMVQVLEPYHQEGCDRGGPLLPGQTIGVGVIHTEGVVAAAWPLWTAQEADGAEGGWLLTAQPVFEANWCAWYYQAFEGPVSRATLQELAGTCEPNPDAVAGLRRRITDHPRFRAGLCRD